MVRFGDVAREVLIEAEAFDADLIAVTARPRNPLLQWVRGVPGKLLRRSHVPVLLVTAR